MADTANWPLASMIDELDAIEAEERAAAQAEKEAREHRKAVADRVADQRDRIRELMKSAGVAQDACPKARVSIVATPARLKVEDDAAIPGEFFDMEPKRSDARIKARLASGMDVPGASLERGETLKVEWVRK